MNTTRKQIYALTNKNSKSHELASILIRAYHNNLNYAYEVLVALPEEEDRLRLLKYIDKEPRMSSSTINRIVSTYMFYRVTLVKNHEYRRIYMTNNPRCGIDVKFNEMRKLNTILCRAYGFDLERVQEILSALPKQEDKLRLLKYIDKKPYLSDSIIKKIIDTYLFYRNTLNNNQEFKQIYQTNNFDLLTKKEDRELLQNFVASLNISYQR